MVTTSLGGIAAESYGAYDESADLAYLRGEILRLLIFVPISISLFFFIADGNRLLTWLPMLAFAMISELCHPSWRSSERTVVQCLIADLFISTAVTTYVYPETAAACLFVIVVAVTSTAIGPRWGLAIAGLASIFVLAIWQFWLEISVDVVIVSISMRANAIGPNLA